MATWLLAGKAEMSLYSIYLCLLVAGLLAVVVTLRNGGNHFYPLRLTGFPFDSCASLQELQGTGFHVEPDVISRLHPNEQTTIAVTAKQDKEGDANVLLTAFVSGSLSYQITLKGKFVVPDLHFYTDILDFGSIKRGMQHEEQKCVCFCT